MFRLVKLSELPENSWKKTDNHILSMDFSIYKLKLLNFNLGIAQIAKSSNCPKIYEVRFFFKSILSALFLVRYFIKYCENKRKHLIVINSSGNALVNEILEFSGLKRNVNIPRYIQNGNTYYDLYIYQS
ncbi:hypothetical protein [Ligilactobacillus apodemi]|uniref:hypothetical protein n=1 Tax=Ligilactobacillus apodemi TaxID=307126 RepID=UPI00214B0EF5|nr:hypothetical protein [Ligilactobacillus apodemi]MCR1901400.1 hypothetical protein [Ligilactobacillus apodemi]